MPRSGLRPDSRPTDSVASGSVEARSLPFQWSLLAWAALVGGLTGLAVVGFHFLLGFINNFLYGPVVEGLIGLFRAAPPEPPPLPEPTAAPGTPLGALLQIGLGGLAFLPPPPPPPDPIPLPGDPLPLWLSAWPVVLVPLLGGVAV